MLQRSRNMITRSAMSAGAWWKTFSSGRKRYSIGSGNSFAARNITESLPSLVSRWCMPSSEPSASPSGPSWAVSKKRSWERISSIMRSKSLPTVPLAALNSAVSAATSAAEVVVISVILLALRAVEQARDPHPFLDRVVVMEGQGRRPFHPLLGGDARLDHTVRGTQRLQRIVALGFVSEHADVDPRRAQVGAGFDPRHGDESEPGIGEFGDRRGDDLAQRLVDPPHARAGHLALLEGLLDLFGLEELEHVALFDVGVPLEHDPALLSLVDFGDVVFEASQRGEFAGPDDGAVAQQADAGGFDRLALGDLAAGDPADFRRFERFFDDDLADRLLDLEGVEQALHRVAQVFGDFVDDRVGADVDALAVGGTAGVRQRPHVEADDDRFGGRRGHHRGPVDATGLRVDDVDRDPFLRDFRELVLERLERAGHVGLEHDVELLDVAGLGAREDLVEAELAGVAAGELLALEAIGALLGHLAGAAVVLDRLHEFTRVGDAVEAEGLDRHPRDGLFDHLA